jgi:hypothetical protein
MHPAADIEENPIKEFSKYLNFSFYASEIEKHALGCE